MNFTKKELIEIHSTVHDHNVKLSIASNGCRYLVYKGITFMEQNKNKASKYAVLVRHGYKITWGIRTGNWILILENLDGVITITQ